MTVENAHAHAETHAASRADFAKFPVIFPVLREFGRA
jgi:hypothetical protein